MFNSLDCSPPGSSVLGILQAGILEWVAFPSAGELLIQGSNPGLLHCRQILYNLSHTFDYNPHIPSFHPSGSLGIVFPHCMFTLVVSLVAQTVKNLPAMQETRVRSLGWKDPLEKAMGTHSSILAWKVPWTNIWDCKESDTTKRLLLSVS